IPTLGPAADIPALRRAAGIAFHEVRRMLIGIAELLGPIDLEDHFGDLVASHQRLDCDFPADRLALGKAVEPGNRRRLIRRCAYHRGLGALDVAAEVGCAGERKLVAWRKGDGLRAGLRAMCGEWDQYRQ